MHELVQNVPRLQSLAVFESAARLGSFTRAAVELGMTQPAVSRRIADLERSAKVALFDRTPNRVTLNSHGTALFTAVQAGFDAISRCIDTFQSDATFLLAANPGFAQHHLVPHLDRLQDALGESDLRLRLFDRDTELADERFDAAIHLAPIASAPPGTIPLFEEVIVPVASPQFARSHGLDKTSRPSEMLGQVKLHLDRRDRQWLDWQAWFDAHQVSWTRGDVRIRYNNYALVMQDAHAGQGVALAWRGLVDTSLESGQLVEVGPEVKNPDNAYLLIPGQAGHDPTFDRVAAWLQAD